jgi:hypothetical protein
MKKIFKNLMTFAVVSILFTSCVNETFDDPKNGECVDPSIVKNKEVSDIYAIAINPTGAIPNTPTYTANDIIEAHVISSDEGGNFYKKIYMQPTDGTKGFYVSLEGTNLYTKKLEPGRKVYIKLKNLAYCNPTSFDTGLTFGAPPTNIYAVDRLETSDIDKHIIPTCSTVNEETIVHADLTVAQAKSATYLNTLVELKNVQFKSDCSTYSKKDFDTSLKITDGTTEIDVRTSHFANFAGNYVPSGNGKIRGVLSKYGSTYQLVLRTERDVKLTNPRIAVVSPPKGGTAITYTGNFTETFESYATSTTGAVLPNYVNNAVVGFKYWDVVLFSSNKYLQTSAFNNGCVKAVFVVPVDFTTANKLSFKTKDGYNDGQPLKVYYSTNYIPGGDVTQATLVDITSSFAIATGSTSGYATNFTNSGDYQIPAFLTGNGYFLFEYDGTTGTTTTMQIDDIKVSP